MQYQIFGQDGVQSSVSIVFADGRLATFNDGHVNFQEVVRILTNPPENAETGYDEEYLYELSRPVLNIGAKLVQISERVTYSEANIFFDGDPIEGAEVNQLVRMIQVGKNINEYRPLVMFLEKIRTNPSEKSRASLYEFLQRHDFTITRDGNFVAYKGVTADGLSIHSGRAIVNGEVIRGRIPNAINSVIEMPRSAVDDDTHAGCSTGLHAGTYNYANGFAQGLLLTVEINPRDVVSVPNDSNYQKIRTCRYIVTGATTVEYTEPVWDDDDDEDDLDYDDDDFYDADDVIDDENSDLIEDSIADNQLISFDYTKTDGTVQAVVDFSAEEVRNNLVTGLNSVGQYRSYKLEGISKLTVGINTPAAVVPTAPVSQDAAVTLVPTPSVVTPSVVSLAKDTAKPVKVTGLVVDVISKAIEDGDVLSFDYQKKDETKPVVNFTPEQVDDVNAIVTGQKSDGEYRSYKVAKITNLTVGHAGVAPTTVDDDSDGGTTDFPFTLPWRN